jgi:CHASE3 domain sensor protein
MAFRLFDFLKRVPPAWVSLGAEDRRRSRRAARIAVTMALVGVFIGFAGLGSYYVISNNSANKERNVYTGDREIAHQLLHARSGLEDFLATGRADLLGGYQAAMKKLNAGLAAMKDESRDGGALALKTSAAVDSLSAEIQDWEARYIRVAIKLRQSNSERALNILRGMQQRGVAPGRFGRVDRGHEGARIRPSLGGAVGGLRRKPRVPRGRRLFPQVARRPATYPPQAQCPAGGPGRLRGPDAPPRQRGRGREGAGVVHRR